MAMNMTIWRIQNDKLETLPKKKLNQEERLEKWIAADPSLAGLDILIIGRQVITEFGGRIDLLGIDQEGDLVVLELKRDKTPRDIVAQVLDYASWIDGLGLDDIEQIAMKYLKKPLSSAFAEHYDVALPETINSSHQMIIVAAELDDASERIAAYLANKHGININVVFFNVFEHEGKELLGRSWLMDPEHVEQKTETKKRVPWTGVWYVNIGKQFSRSWEDRRNYGFVSAGGGEPYSRPLTRLKLGDRLFAYATGHGYIGYGEVVQERTLATEFVPQGESKALPALELETKIPTHGGVEGNEEYAVGVKWMDAVPIEEAKRFTGAFANQIDSSRIEARGRLEKSADLLFPY